MVGIEEVERRLKEATAGAGEVILFCHEKTPDKFCHRMVFAQWYEEKTGEVIEEVG